MLNARNDKPILIAGPCMAESYDLLCQVAQSLVELQAQHGFTLIFKASFDKANRSSASSARGPGLAKFLQWVVDLKQKFPLQVITDVHETAQVEAVAAVCDAVQIPAFLCRQTDLILKAAASGRIVNIKKGQFMSPWAMQLLAASIKERCATSNCMLTERGSSFGYGRLVVDMSGLQVMASSGVPIIYDVTHSVQCPPAAERSATTRGNRYRAPPWHVQPPRVVISVVFSWKCTPIQLVLTAMPSCSCLCHRQRNSCRNCCNCGRPQRT